MDLFDSIDNNRADLHSLPPGEVPAKSPETRLPQAVARCLHAGGLVVTGNARAARALSTAYATVQQRNGLEAWRSPNIRDWAGWMASLWNEMLVADEESRLLLSPLQEHALWKSVAQQHGDAGLVVSVDGMAELALSAYARLSSFLAQGTRRRPWDYSGSRDAEAFRQWASTFDKLCERAHWISRSALEKEVAGAIASGRIPLPAQILLTGFDLVAPAQQTILDALKAAGTGIEFLESSAQSGKPGAAAIETLPERIEAKDLRDEIAACASWARQMLLREPGSRIAVLVQDQAAMRGELDRTFRRILLPASIGLNSEAAPTPYEFSLGRPLALMPAIRAALLLLRWVAQPLPLEEVSWLLLSGFLAEQVEEFLPLAQVDAEMRGRERMPPEIGLDWWLRQSVVRRTEAIEGLRKRLSDVRESAALNGIGDDAVSERRNRNSQKTYSEWMDIALQLVGIAGWPGPHIEDSVQFQARKKWEQLTDAIAALAFDGSRVGYPEFVTVLCHTAGQTIFSPQSRNAPIQIMGPLESAGQQFDAIWFLGADDQHWPPTGSPHPLIPLQVQRDAGMPYVTAEDGWELARRITGRIAESAPECIFSYAKQTAAGIGKPSPLIAAVFGSVPPVKAALTFLSELGVVSQPPHPSRVVDIVDSSFIAWPEAENAGGAEILKMQAACPFKAFATRRLGARDINEAERGLSQRDRGTLLHKVLQNLWAETNEAPWRLRDRDDLINAIAAGHLAAILEHHVSEAIGQLTNAADDWTVAYFASEQERLCGLLAGWLEREAQRAPFEVEACEKKLDEVRVGALKLKLRIDRIDRLPSGARLLIDYKTSTVSATVWQSDQPDDPQLPLYAAYGDVAQLQGVLFAQIRPHDLKFVGLVADSRKALGFPNKDYDDAVRDQWSGALRILAEDFLHGTATVTPKKYPKTCEYCALPSLCRVADTPLPVVAMEVDSEFDFGSGAGGRYE